MTVFKQWFLKEILQMDKLNTLLVLPITKQAVDYRDVPPEYFLSSFQACFILHILQNTIGARCV